MNVSALAEVLAGSRGPDGVICVHKLEQRLPGAGLDEFARAFAALVGRANPGTRKVLDDPQPDNPWF